jgi:NADH-quinone oxidoreductase subunit M
MSTLLLAQEGSTDFPILPALILLPAVGSAVVAVLSKRRPDLIKVVALLFSVAPGAISVWMLSGFEKDSSEFQFVSHQSWISDLGISWFLGVDGISLFLVVLTGILFPLAIFGVDPGHEEKPYYAWLLLLEAGCMGVFMALDLLLFFVFFEIVLVPMYFLIAKWGHGRRQYAALKFFLYTMFGSAFMLVGLVATAVLHARETGGSITFDLVTLAETQVLPVTTGRWIFLAFAIAFAVKVPLFPVHTWLPDAHTEAPTAGSVILAGIMLKLGTYGFLRFGVYLFPEAAVYFAPLMVTLGVIGIIYGAIVATMQRDLKRLVAYSSVAHLGFIILGTFALNRQGIEGGVLQMVNHGLSTGALFFLVGMIYERRHTREIAELRGLQKAAPIMAGVFTVVMLSSIGLPGLNGFVGEFLTLLGAFASHRWWAVVATAGVILAALYLLWAYQRVFHGTPDDANRAMPDLRPREVLLLAPLLGLIVFLGVYPKPVLDRMEPSVVALIDHVERNVPDFTEDGPKTDEQREEEKAERDAHAPESGGAAGEGEHR